MKLRYYLPDWLVSDPEFIQPGPAEKHVPAGLLERVKRMED